MKVHFVVEGRRYIAPSKSEAYNFLSFWNFVPFPGAMKRLDVTWNIKHVELAPSYGQLMPVGLEKIEYK